MKHNNIIVAALALLCIGTPKAEAQNQKENWLNPTTTRVNTVAPRASFFAYETEELARTCPVLQQQIYAQKDSWQWQDPKARSNRFLSLHGLWKFNFVQYHNLAPKGFYAPAYNDAEWDDMPVPGLFEFNGYGTKIYKNAGYAWSTQFENNPPLVEERNNYTGSYRKTLVVPADWKGQQVFLHVGSATSNLQVWVNGKEVGYSEDSKMEAEFDVTRYLVPGEQNVLALQVMRWCDGSYLEDQDFWRFTGLAREVYLYARPQVHVQDLFALPTLADAKGILDLTVKADGKAKGYTVEATLLDGTATKAQGVETFQTQETTFHFEVADAKVWSAEEPNLYTLIVTLKDKKGNVVESVPQRIGFRTVEIKNAQVLVNGQPILFKGADRHELDPDDGYCVSMERMVEDIRIMKELNMNAVRTCHYPDDPRWYDLCDELGIYLVAEANVESHGMGYGQTTLAKEPMFEKAHIERNQHNVEVQKNHASIIFWSLGNEAGYGPNFEKAYDAVKALDTSRPVQYERAGLDGKTDVFCPMYFGYNDCDYYCKNNPKKPLIQCEYAHAMGNSIGGFAEYWDLVRKHPNYQGGVIWDFVDQAARGVSKVTGREIMAYGGDYGRYPASDHNFNCNGVIAADRKPHPHAYEIQYYYQNLWATYADGTVEVFNENFFRPVDDVRMVVTKTVVKGTQVAQQSGDYDVNIAPQAKQRIALDPTLCTPGDGETLLDIRFELKRDRGLLSRGFVVAKKQVQLAAGDGTGYMAESGKVIKDEALSWVTLAAGRVSVTWNKQNGAIDYYDVDGRNILADDTSVEPSFWRAPTDNDYGAGLQNRLGAWKYARWNLKEMTSTDNSVNVVYTSEQLRTRLTMAYVLDDEGTLFVTEDLDVDEEAEQKPQMMAMGMTWRFRPDFDTYTYFGRGPVENYADRKDNAFLGVYTQAVKDSYWMGYVRPQESGNHTDIRYWTMQAGSTKVTFHAAGNLECSALPYEIEDLDGGPDKGARQMHSGDLVERNYTVLQVRAFQMGLGCVNSWGAWARDEYVPKYEDHTFHYTVTVDR